jgi:hypothetical protein
VSTFDFKAWLWPDKAISKRASRTLREEHNALLNAFSELQHLRTEQERMTGTVHKIAIEARFLGPTNCRGSRVSLRLPRWQKRVSFPWDYVNPPNTVGQAEVWLASKGIKPDTLLDMETHYVFACPWEQREAIFKAFNIPERT